MVHPVERLGIEFGRLLKNWVNPVYPTAIYDDGQKTRPSHAVHLARSLEIQLLTIHGVNEHTLETRGKGNTRLDPPESWKTNYSIFLRKGAARVYILNLCRVKVCTGANRWLHISVFRDLTLTYHVCVTTDPMMPGSVCR